jgi:hypothetical protein
VKRHVASTLLLASVFLLVLGGTARATFDTNEIGCRGSAVIRGEGQTVRVNATDAEVTIPRQGVARWQGGTSAVSKNHSGNISVVAGPFALDFGDWGDPNEGGEKSKKGTRRFPDELVNFPPGVYLVSGSHSGDSGSCSGHINIILSDEGGGGGAPWKPIGLAGTGLFAVATLAAGIARKP